MKQTTLGDFLAEFGKLPPETPIMLNGFDHSYREASAHVEEVSEDGPGEYSQYYAGYADSEGPSFKAIIIS